MTYGWVRDQVLKLLNQYTMAGTPIPASYNNQADYLNRIPSLVNDAILEIATTAKKISATVDTSDLYSEPSGEYVKYTLPENFYQFRTGSFVTTKKGKRLHTNAYQIEGRSYIYIPKDEDGDYLIQYYRYPALLSSSPSDNDTLDNTEETHTAIPFYVASFLVDEDDTFKCALFMNKYEDKLAKMSSGISAEIFPTEDVYDIGLGVW